MWYVRPAKTQISLQSDQSLKYSMTIKLLTEQDLEFLSLKGGCTGSYICSAQSENLGNSGIALRKVRIPKLADRVRILTLHGTIPELSVRKVRIGTK